MNALRRILLASCLIAASFNSACADTLTVTTDPAPLRPGSVHGGGTPPDGGQPPSPPVQIPFRMDMGAVVPFTDGSANLWQIDQYCPNVNRANWGAIAIAGTTDDTLYQTEAWQVGGFSCAIPIVNGTYTVTLYNSENWTAITAAGQRVFDVKMEGAEVVSDWDIYSQAGNARNTAVNKAVNVTVADGVLNIDFIAQTQNPKIDAVKIDVISAPEPPAATYPTVLASQTTAIQTTSGAVAPVFRAALSVFKEFLNSRTSYVDDVVAQIGDDVLIPIGFRDETISTAQVNTVTCGSQQATFIAAGTIDNSIRRRVEWWVCLDVAVTNFTITATFSESVSQGFMAPLAYTGVDSIGAAGAQNTGVTNNWDASVTTNRVNSLVLAVGMLGLGSSGPFTPDDTETERADDSTYSGDANQVAWEILEAPAATIGTYNLGGAGDTSAAWAASAIALRGPTGGSSTITLASNVNAGQGDDYVIVGCTGDIQNVSTPAGWSSLNINGVAYPGNTGRLWAWHRIADATWPGVETTVPFSMAGDQQSAWISLVLEGHRSSVTSPHGGQNGGQTTAAFDPPNLATTSGIAENLLSFALFGADETSNTSPYAPSGYTATAQVESSQAAGSCSIDLARKEVTGPSEDPGTMAYGATKEGIAATLFFYSGTEGQGGSPANPPICAPSSQSVQTDTFAAFTASSGNGTFTWSAPGASITSGSGPTFQTSWVSAGAKTVTLTSGALTNNCNVVVTSAPPGGGPGATSIYYIDDQTDGTGDGTVYDPTGNVFLARGMNDYYNVGLPASGDLAYMGTPGWNVNTIRFRQTPAPAPGGIPSAGYLSELDAYLAGGKVVWNDWVNFDNSFHEWGGWPTSSTAWPMDLDDLKEWQRRFAIKYGTAGTNPNERLWYAMVNEPGGGPDAVASGGLHWDVTRVDAWKFMAASIINTVRSAGAKAPIIVPSMMGADDLEGPNWDFAQAFVNWDVTERSSIIKYAQEIMNAAPTVTGSNGKTTKNLCFAVHLYGNYNAVNRKQYMDDFFSAAKARGICVVIEEWSHCLDTANGCTDQTAAMNNMRDLRIENGGYRFHEMYYTWDASDPMNLTTTSPVTNNGFSGPDCRVGAASCKDVSGNPTNLTSSGQVFWDSVTH